MKPTLFVQGHQQHTDVYVAHAHDKLPGTLASTSKSERHGQKQEWALTPLQLTVPASPSGVGGAELVAPRRAEGVAVVHNVWSGWMSGWVAPWAAQVGGPWGLLGVWGEA